MLQTACRTVHTNARQQQQQEKQEHRQQQCRRLCSAARTKKCCTQVHLKCIYINIMMRTRPRTKFVWPGQEICPGCPRAQQLQLCVCLRPPHHTLPPPLASWLTPVNAPMPIDRSDSFEVVFGVFLVQDLALFSNSREGCAKTYTEPDQGRAAVGAILCRNDC